MDKLLYLCKARGTLELGYIMRTALDNGLLSNIKSDRERSQLQELLTNTDEVTIFKWLCNPKDAEPEFKTTLDTILACFNGRQQH